jgi:acetoin utilization protein AcuB
MKLASLMVSDYMTPNPITVEPEEPLMRALEIIRLRRVRRLPVAVGGVFVGLITEGDVKRRALVDVMREAKAAAG